jgi:hypothetical protein
MGGISPCSVEGALSSETLLSSALALFMQASFCSV